MSTSLSPALQVWHPRNWPYARMGILLAVVTIGGSQVLFSLILGNPAFFPSAASFHLWVLFWTQVLPAALLFTLDTVFLRLAGQESRGMRFWRAFLYSLSALLVLRQVQVSHAGLFYALVPPGFAAPAYAALALAVGILGLRKPRVLDRYCSVLGILALILTAQYVRGTLMTGPDAAGSATGAAPARPGRPIVLLVFDEWSLDTLVKDGRIDREAFPRVAALADEGAWFPRATSNSPSTEISTLILMTGRRQPAEDSPALFDRLRDTHRVTVQMAAPDLKLLFEKRAAKPGDRYLSRTDGEALRLTPLEVPSFLAALLVESAFVFEGWSGPSRDRLPPLNLWDVWGGQRILSIETASFLGLVTKRYGQGRFLYWHCSQPHPPFLYDAKGVPHGRSHDSFVAGSRAHENEIWENYLEAARGVDRLVGLVVDRLKAEGIYEDTTLIVTSDHGIRTGGAMEEGGYPEVRNGRVVRIPFLIRGPSVRPGVYDAEYQTMDFAPTLLDVLGVPFAPGDFDGVSAFRAERPEREPTFSIGDEVYRLDRASGLWKRKRE